MRLLAVVVLYHPGKDLAGNINSYLSQADRLLLWLSLIHISEPTRPY